MLKLDSRFSRKGLRDCLAANKLKRHTNLDLVVIVAEEPHENWACLNSRIFEQREGGNVVC